MGSSVRLLLQLLLLSLVSASSYFGGTTTYSYKGRNPDGSFKVDIRDRDTYDGCYDSLYWFCSSGDCGYVSTIQTGTLDSSTGAPQYNEQWCETERVTSRIVGSNKPFQMRADSCCWTPTVNYDWSWLRVNTLVDLGERSDTGEPNRSPEIAILPFIRVPQNCPRTYRLMSFDPNGDKVRCRYGNPGSEECNGCIQHSGFNLDQDSCTLYYQNTNADSRVRAFEMVVEDFPQGRITLTYTDGSQSYRSPLSARRRKRDAETTTTPSNTDIEEIRTTPSNTDIEEIRTTPSNTDIEEIRTTSSTTDIEEIPTTTSFTTTEEITTTPSNTDIEEITPTEGWDPETTTTPIFTTTDKNNTTPTIPLWWTTSPPLEAITLPLSTLPLQFSFLVDPPAPSCQEGLYLPKFVHPTPANGERIYAEVNKEVEIRIKAVASYAVIQHIIISGPMNMTRHRTTHDEFVLRWTPSSTDLGDYFPVCFAAESATGSDVYQSEMRCVVLHVEKEEIITSVVCTESAMRIEVEKSSLHGLHEDNLRLSEHSNTLCSLDRYSNSTHIIGIIPLNACGTQLEEDEENLIFKNEITTVDDRRDLITREHHLEIEFYCQYPKKGNATVGFTAHRENVEVWDKGFGKFTYQFEFYPNNQFQNMIDPNSYPLEYEVGQKIYMELDASYTVNDTEIFVESCRATPYDNPNYHPSYSIIEDGCPEDPTLMVHVTDSKRQFRFSIEAFKFIGLYDQVYISCSVLMCEAGNPNTRCSQGCINSKSGDHHHHHHRKRDAAIQTVQHFISQGPLRLKRSADSSTAGNNLNLNLNLVFIAGCLLVVVGMICGAAMYRSKMSKVKYQPLPSCES